MVASHSSGEGRPLGGPAPLGEPNHPLGSILLNHGLALLIRVAVAPDGEVPVEAVGLVARAQINDLQGLHPGGLARIGDPNNNVGVAVLGVAERHAVPDGDLRGGFGVVCGGGVHGSIIRHGIEPRNHPIGKIRPELECGEKPYSESSRVA